jgi:two-component system NtrC family sensor kinase
MNSLTDLEQRNLYLEQKVKELTQDLQDRDLQVYETLTKFKKIQEHLLQVEKMAMLGQMVAGISHEINNPINFIYGNLPYVEEHIHALLQVLAAYQDAYPNPSKPVENTLVEAELDFVLEDLPRLIDSMKLGAERIRELVLNLRSFYRLDEAQMKQADINVGIENTLVILQNRYKQKIEIIRHFGEIPPVECHINQLNQVFMNLLSNAIDALLAKDCCEQNLKRETQNSWPQKQITISTELQGSNRVMIKILDNGVGMTSEVQKHIFDPFFTTKPIGIGTGLGLSISQQIIKETHGGDIYCLSTPDQGTTFVVELPICQTKLDTPLSLENSMKEACYSGNLDFLKNEKDL